MQSACEGMHLDGMCSEKHNTTHLTTSHPITAISGIMSPCVVMGCAVNVCVLEVVVMCCNGGVVMGDVQMGGLVMGCSV